MRVISEGKCWFDAHCHLTDPLLDEIIETVLERGHDVGIGGYIMGGSHPSDWHRQQRLTRHRGASIFSTFGIHPWFCSCVETGELDLWLNELARLLPEAVGIGEIGLDFHRAKQGFERKWQEALFLRQLTLAIEQHKPVVLHVVKAHSEVQRHLKAVGRGCLCGFVHGFTGSIDLAKRYLDLGFHLSFGPKALGSVNEALVRFVPSDRLLIESDAPAQWRRDATHLLPVVIVDVAQRLASIRGQERDSLLDSATHNLLKLFALR